MDTIKGVFHTLRSGKIVPEGDSENEASLGGRRDPTQLGVFIGAEFNHQTIIIGKIGVVRVLLVPRPFPAISNTRTREGHALTTTGRVGSRRSQASTADDPGRHASTADRGRVKGTKPPRPKP